MRPDHRRVPVAAAMLAAALLAAPLARASVPLRGIMHGWRAGTRSAQAMLSGRVAFDPAAMRNVLEDYAGASGQIEGQVNGRGADARAFRAGFERLRGDARSALGDLGQRSRLAADFSRIAGDCNACHDRFR